MLKDQQRKTALICLLLFAAAFLSFSAGTGSMSYSSPDEKRYIQSAAEMAGSGDWITPTYHGRPRFQKPILFYWLSALPVKLLGEGYTAARLPSVLSGALVIVVTFLFGSFFYSARAGIYSAGCLAASWLFFAYSRLATPDMATLFFMTLSVYLFARYSLGGGRRLFGYLFFASLGAAFLAKGFAGIAIPLVIAALFPLILKDGKAIRMPVLLAGILIFLVVALPWFMAMYRTHGAQYIYHIWQTETLDRARNIFREGGNAAASGVVYMGRYAAAGFILFLPACLFLPSAVLRGGRKKEDRLFLVWIAAVIVFYSLIGARKYHYLLALSPALCLVIGAYMDDFASGRTPFRPFAIPHTAIAIAYIAGILASVYLFVFLLGITPAPSGYLALASAALSLFFAARRDRPSMAAAFIVSSVLVLAFTLGSMVPRLNEDNGLIVLSDRIAALTDKGDRVGIGSHFISHNRVDAYLDMNTKKVNVDLADPREQLSTSRALLEKFLGRDERVFCLMLREDYENYLTAGLRKRAYVLSKAWYWKKPNQLEPGLDMLEPVIMRDRKGFREAFKNEIYLISNRPE
jgi:4-amino-4-deoxy-L-arabinose transferase-like glycosyltransferase